MRLNYPIRSAMSSVLPKPERWLHEVDLWILTQKECPFRTCIYLWDVRKH